MHKSVLAEDVLPDGTALSYVMHGVVSVMDTVKDSNFLENMTTSCDYDC